MVLHRWLWHSPSIGNFVPVVLDVVSSKTHHSEGDSPVELPDIQGAGHSIPSRLASPGGGKDTCDCDESITKSEPVVESISNVSPDAFTISKNLVSFAASIIGENLLVYQFLRWYGQKPSSSRAF